MFNFAGDVFYVNWDEVLPGATSVISTLGGFGSEEQMQRINGEANIVSVTAAKEYGRIIFPCFPVTSHFEIKLFNVTFLNVHFFLQEFLSLS